jgi:hypothetical protein
MLKLYAVKVWRTSEPRNFETIWVRTSTARRAQDLAIESYPGCDAPRAKRVRRWNLALCRARRVSRRVRRHAPGLEPWLTDILTTWQFTDHSSGSPA